MSGVRQPVSEKLYLGDATHDFYNLRMREILGRLRNPFKRSEDRLLSLAEVRRILKPTSEAYRGTRSVPLRLIVGSEGRYNDFTRSFLPRHAKLKARWMRVDLAYYRNINLPPVRLYELGGAYFVRDGNHRVSVSVKQGGEFIDAEVTSLGTYFTIRPSMTTEEMEAGVVEYERVRFLSETHVEDLVPHFEMYFSSPGRYDVVLSHIISHREQMKRSLGRDVALSEAVPAWHREVYEPVLQAIGEKDILAAFPGRTPADLYVWIMDHRELLMEKHGRGLSVVEAAASFGEEHRASWLSRVFPRRGGRPRRPPSVSQ